MKALDKKHKQRAKNSKRSRAAFPNLQKKFHNLNVHEFLDYDYIGQLSTEEKKWFDKFNEEYYRAYFNKKTNKHVHKKAQRKEVYSANNARNRDLYAQSLKTRTLELVEDSKTYMEKAVENYEDELIECLDNQVIIDVQEEE
jgi:hypothetical protein